MTDEEKAEEYLRKNKISNNENWEVNGKYCYTLCKQAYLDRLAESRKELEMKNFGYCIVLKEDNGYIFFSSNDLKNWNWFGIPYIFNSLEECKEMYKAIKERIMVDKRNDLGIISLTKSIKIS